SQLTITNPNVAMDGYKFRIKVTDLCNTIVYSEPVDLNVAPYTLEIALTGDVTKTYDSGTGAVLALENYNLSESLGNDEINLSNFQNGSFDNKNIGENKEINVEGLALSGASAANYILSTSSLTKNIGTITPADLQIELTGVVSK